MFETGNSTSPLSSPTPDSRPKPLGRVKTSFVAIGGSQGVGLGLQKVETSDKDKLTDEPVEKDKTSGMEELETKHEKDDKIPTKPDIVKVDEEAEKPEVDDLKVAKEEGNEQEQPENTVASVDETLEDKPTEQAAEIKEVPTDPSLVQLKDVQAVGVEKETTPKVEEHTKIEEDAPQETSKDKITNDTIASEETDKESPAAPEKLEAVPSEEKSEDPLVLADADVVNEASTVETESAVVPDPAIVDHKQAQTENDEVPPTGTSSTKEETPDISAAKEKSTDASAEEVKGTESSDILSDIEASKHEESQVVVEDAQKDIEDVKSSMQVTTEPEPAPEPEIAQEKETIPDVEELVPDATLTQSLSSAEKVGVIPEEKKPEVPAEPVTEKVVEKLPEAKEEPTSPAKAKKSKKGKKSKAAKESSSTSQEAAPSTSQSQESAEENKPVQSASEKPQSAESEVVGSDIEVEAPKQDEPVETSTTVAKDGPENTTTTSPATVHQTDQYQPEEKEEAQNPIIEPSSSVLTSDDKGVPLTDVIPDSVKEEILEAKSEDSKLETQEESSSAEKADSTEVVDPEVSTAKDPVKQTLTHEKAEDVTPAPLADATTKKVDTTVDQDVVHDSTESAAEPVPEVESQPDLDKQEVPVEDATAEDKSLAPVADKQQSPKAVKKPPTSSKVSDKKILKPSTSSSSSQPSPSTKPSITPAPVAKKAPIPKASLPSTRKPVETSNKSKVPEQPVKLSKAPISALTTSKKLEVKKPLSPTLPSQPVDDNVIDPTSIITSDENVSESSDNKLKPAVDTTLMPPPVSPAAKVPSVAEKKPTKPRSSHSRTSSLVKNETTSVESPPKATVRQRPISAYAPTSSSASKTLTVKEPTKPVVKSSRSPSRLAALSNNSVGRPSSRASNAHAPSPNRNDPRAGERQFSSRQSMTSEINIQSRTIKPIDSDFLTRLSRPTASSASKVVDKIPTTFSHPIPHLPKKHSTSQTRRKGDQDSHKDGEARNDSDENDVEGQGPQPVDENNTQAHEVVDSVANEQPTTQ